MQCVSFANDSFIDSEGNQYCLFSDLYIHEYVYEGIQNLIQGSLYNDVVVTRPRHGEVLWNEVTAN